MEPLPVTGPLAVLQTQFPPADFALLGLVLALPALGAIVNGLFGKRLGKDAVRLMALTALGGAFVASVVTFLLVPHEGRLTWNVWRWFAVTGRMQQSVPIDVAFSVDAMTAVMMLVVTGVGFLIHLYSTEYMREEPSFHRFFAYLNLFCFAMLVLIMADNLAVLFVGWEGVGLCSYLLIGFWFQEDKNASAGRKAFVVNRIGDFGLIVAMSMLVYYCGTLRWDGINEHAPNLLTQVKIWPLGNLSHETLPRFVADLILPKEPVMVYASTLVGFALFLGCAGKSAQIPLYVWLPDAMAGPTPVSALIHAATMVTAGVYLVARLSAVFVLSPAALACVAVVGAATALFAASIGLLQNDLKKVLAYSTVSQLGFMFIGVGVGAFTAGLFHVLTHAFFKACLFLGAGSVIHAMHARIHDTDASQDMRNMGGLKAWMPLTRWSFLASCLAIAGCPPFAGFWSKDEILGRAYVDQIVAVESSKANPMWSWPTWLGPAVYWVGVVAATMTAFYMFRAYFMTFHGPFRGWKIVRGWVSHGHDEHDTGHHGEAEAPLEGPEPHESPWAMTLPLVVLGTLAAVAGFLYAGPLHIEPFAKFLEPVFAQASKEVTERPGASGISLMLMLPGVGAFLAGTGLAVAIYWNRQGAPEATFRRAFPRLYRLVYDKWRIDELYDATVVGMVDALADIFTVADRWIVDGILAKLTAAVVAAVGTVARAFQTGRVQAYSASIVIGVAGLGWFFMQPHADAMVDAANVTDTGEVKITAAPGYGYSYRWEGPGLSVGDAFGAARDVTVKLSPGERRSVILHVRNAYGREATETIPLERPASRDGAPQAPKIPLAPRREPAPAPKGGAR
ncbi:MAG TPA: NADH-quinone oxidoreductase subunit L [Minicystis sp.]|nr:NADH-quinone oxidoreductase subunit L [Minicystis sp.]